jgi:hypothetical protein
MTGEESWVNAMRALSLARLLLTEREDLDVIEDPPRLKYDLLVRVRTEDLAVVPEFAVEVKGTRRRVASQTLQEWLADLRAQGPVEPLPWCLFVFHVETRQGHYCWLNEPIISKKSVALRSAWEPRSISRNHNQELPVIPALSPLDEHSLDSIVTQVIGWAKAQERIHFQHAHAS